MACLHAGGDWTGFRKLPGKVAEADFHESEGGRRDVAYWDAVSRVRDEAFEAIKAAHESGTDWLIIRHGWSTSRAGATTARSAIRRLMIGTAVTPFVLKSKSIQHQSVFVVAIRPPAGRRHASESINLSAWIRAHEDKAAERLEQPWRLIP